MRRSKAEKKQIKAKEKQIQSRSKADPEQIKAEKEQIKSKEKADKSKAKANQEQRIRKNWFRFFLSNINCILAVNFLFSLKSFNFNIRKQKNVLSRGYN